MGGNRELAFHEHRVSVWDDVKVLEIGSDDDSTDVNILNSTSLDT